MLEDMDSQRPVSRRPVFLDLRAIHLPVNAWVSILHRVSGVFLLLGVPLCWGGRRRGAALGRCWSPIC